MFLHQQILLFIFWKAKTCQLQLWFELMKNTIPQKIRVLFSRPKKIPASFIDPKKSLLAKMSDPKNPSDPPVIKICEWGPWVYTCMFLVLISWLVVMHIEEEAMWLVGILLLYLWLYPIAVASSPDLPVVCGKSICLMLLFQGHATCRNKANRSSLLSLCKDFHYSL